MTVIVCFKIAVQFGTRIVYPLVEVQIFQRINGTAVFVRALGVEYAKYVRLTADEAQISLDALAKLHSAVQGVTHHNHFVMTARR